VMRRQMSNQDIHLHVGSHGEMNSLSAEPIEAASSLMERGEPLTPYCNTFYPLGTPDTNNCRLNHKKIQRKEDCEMAASKLGLPQAPAIRTPEMAAIGIGGYAFQIDDDTENPDPFPKGCLVWNNSAYWNPTDSVRTSGWQGTPICWQPVYLHGNLSEDSDTGCSGEYEKISVWNECKWAKECEWGGMQCVDPNFLNNAYSTHLAPRGCYQDTIGCYGYNARTSPLNAATSNITGKNAVCRLKSWNFTGPEVVTAASIAAGHHGNSTSSDDAAVNSTA